MNAGVEAMQTFSPHLRGLAGIYIYIYKYIFQIYINIYSNYHFDQNSTKKALTKYIQ